MTTRTSTDRPTETASSAFDRLADFILDRNGTTYGVDERERQRWMEAIAVTWQVQMLLMLGALAVMSWLADASAVRYLWVMYVLIGLPCYVALTYLGRHNVEVKRLHIGRKARMWQLLTTLLYLAASIGLIWGRAIKSGNWSSWSGSSGGVVGMIFGFVFVMVLIEKRNRQLKEQFDKHTDGDD